MSEPAVFPGLEGVSVLVTGAASAIGRATSLVAARSGASVLAGDTDEDGLGSLANEAATQGLAITTTHLDVTDPAGIARTIDAASATAPLHGVANVASVAPMIPAADISIEQWNQVLAVNLTGTFLVAQGAAKAIAAHGAGGAIVNVGSVAMGSGVAELAAYSAAKSGLLGLTRTFAREFGPARIRVNLVSPGAVEDAETGGPGTPGGGPASLPLGRLGQPLDIAHSIVFLMSDYAAWFTGQHVNVNGGAHMH